MLNDEERLKEKTLEAVDRGIEKARSQGNEEQVEELQECRELLEDGKKGEAVRKLLASENFDFSDVKDAL